MSTLDAEDIDIMKATKTCVAAERFQYDYLNDDIAEDGSIDYSLSEKLPLSLRKAIEVAKSGKAKILILMNPPYAEAGKGMSKGDKENVAKTRVAQHCMAGYGKSSNELFTQFLARIAQEIPNATIAMFSKLKYINAPNFEDFRKKWNAEYLAGFVVHSKAFDGLKGDFPIGFLVWQTHNGKGAARTPITEVSCEVLDKNVQPVGEKTFYNIAKDKYLNVWIKRPRRNDEDALPLSNAITVSTVKHPVTKWADGAIAYLYCNTNDIQHARQNTVLYSSTYGDGHGFYVTEENLWQAAVLFTARRIIKHTWTNDRDQFLQADKPLPDEFINDCLIWMLFNGSNLTASALRLEWQGKDWTLVNHFIPYTEEEVNSSSRFESNFLHSYMQGKTYSNEALAVLEAGKHIWHSYFATSFPHSIRSSLHLDRSDVGWYQIRQAFKALSASGDSDVASRFTMLENAFKIAYACLADKLKPQVYELGFLK